MPDDGYTLSEMLVALMMTGLAMTGVAMATRMVTTGEAKAQAARQAAADLRRIDVAVTPLFRRAGPFRSAGGADESLTGAGDRVAFARDGRENVLTLYSKANQAVLEVGGDGGPRAFVLHAVRAPVFRYVSALDGQVSASWPVMREDRLGAVVLVSAGAPLGVFKIGREQPAACAFDVRTHGCSPAGGAP